MNVSENIERVLYWLIDIDQSGEIALALAVIDISRVLAIGLHNIYHRRQLFLGFAELVTLRSRRSFALSRNIKCNAFEAESQ